MPISLLLISLLAELLRALAQAAGVLPLVIALTLLCSRGERKLLGLLTARMHSLWLPFLLLAGPLSTLMALAQFIGQMALAKQEWTIPSLFAPGLLPSTVNCVLWLFAIPFALLLARLLQANGEAIVEKRKWVAVVLAFFLALLCFSAWFSLSWPFAGLPEGLSRREAFFAILSHTEHSYFFALLPCALFWLWAFPSLHRFLTKHGCQEGDTVFALRTIAAIGLFGALPHTLHALGTGIGYILRAADLPKALMLGLVQTGMLTTTLLCLGFLVFDRWHGLRRTWRFSALFFFFLSLTLPLLLDHI